MNPTTKEQTITDELFDAIMAVRDTGATNMFSIQGVINCARALGEDGLVAFLSDRKNARAYTNFIITGER